MFYWSSKHADIYQQAIAFYCEDVTRITIDKQQLSAVCCLMAMKKIEKKLNDWAEDLNDSW